MARDALPDWALGLVIVAGAATAMVPAAGMLVGISTMVASTLVPTQPTAAWSGSGRALSS
ncbi:hypothetical protein [Prauserella alba]|uniref:Uncharacterized protein n=1 Tax=Prauserella alba TaxID=176898 RepID=A0ABP4GIG7_9PSEU|nr:hypothetical protein [Prauserella alba]